MASDPWRAALKGAEQIGFTILSLTVSLIAVLIPLLFMGDVVGRLFREFAVTLAVTIVVSAVVSLTLTPMMSARILRHQPKEQQGRIYQATERAFESMIAFLWAHTESCAALPDNYFVGCPGYAVAHDFPLHRHSQGLRCRTPASSRRYRRRRKRLARRAWRKQKELAKIILDILPSESLSSFIGADGTNTTTNSGRMSINLKLLDQRKMSASDVIRRLTSKLDQVQGIQLFMQPVQNITVDDRVSRTQYQYTLEDPDANEL